MLKDASYIERIIRKMRTELGLVHEYIVDPDVIEIMVNPDGKVWIERFGSEPRHVGDMSVSQRASLLSTIATSLDTSVNASNPILEGELLIDNSRFEGLFPPIAEAPCFTIRKRANAVFTLQDYVQNGNLQIEHKLALDIAIQQRKNILVVGGTGSGKTTFSNAIIHSIEAVHPHHRIIIIEDTREIQCTSENHMQLRSTDNISMLQLLRATMRLRPDRILVGEVRGGEALALLKAWNTGHPGGLATVHANSARGGLIRIEQLISEASTSPMRELIAEAIDFIVYIENRNIIELLEISGINNNEYQLFDIPTYHQKETQNEISAQTKKRSA